MAAIVDALPSHMLLYDAEQSEDLQQGKEAWEHPVKEVEILFLFVDPQLG